MFWSKKPKEPKLPKYAAALYMNHIEGLEAVPYNEGVGVHVRTGESDLEIEYNKEKIFLPLSQIVKISIITWEKTIATPLNPLAEGIVGGLIGGSTMAVVSAIDAKGRTRAEHIKLERALEIQYRPRGEFRAVKRLVFWDKSDFSQKKDTIRFAEKLCRLANLPAPNFIEPEAKGPTYL